ncbi:YciI family protein [Roseibium alexandrii]|uniref:YciI-like protein n=1 Tax=Roseibium alexandrii TaxID=388408 RepID=A0A0M7A380_9HYPH|nr:YciI family protein [Roseibium alexandrii]CTQ69525.1 YciI-like protein [Roseibium alexandrii]
MQFVVYAIDKPDALRLRLEVLEAHRHFLGTEPERYGVKVLLSGPLTEDDGSTMRGSFFLLEADNREKIKDMFANDPLQAAGVWAEQQISAVTVRQNNMRTDQ